MVNQPLPGEPFHNYVGGNNCPNPRCPLRDLAADSIIELDSPSDIRFCSDPDCPGKKG